MDRRIDTSDVPAMHDRVLEGSWRGTFAPSKRVSSTVRYVNMDMSCSTYADTACMDLRSAMCPLRRMRPDTCAPRLTGVRYDSTLRKDVLPLPDCPSTTTSSPECATPLRLLKTCLRYTLIVCGRSEDGSE